MAVDGDIITAEEIMKILDENRSRVNELWELVELGLIYHDDGSVTDKQVSLESFFGQDNRDFVIPQKRLIPRELPRIKLELKPSQSTLWVKLQEHAHNPRRKKR